MLMANLLDVLPEYVLSWIVQKGKERWLEQGEVLLREGEKSQALYIVLDGLFGVDSGVHDSPLSEHAAPGSVVGDVSLFTGTAIHARVVAHERSLVLEINKQLLDGKLEHDHVYAADFYRAMLLSVAFRLHHARTEHFAHHADEEELRRHPQVRRAQVEIDRFKSTMLRLDKEALKEGVLSDASLQQFHEMSHDLMDISHEVLGTASSLSDIMKQQIGDRLQREMLPYILTTETAERFYSKPRGYAGDYLSIHNIYTNKASGTGRLGPVVDRMFLETPPSRAVRNRRALLAREIVASVEARKGEVVNVMCMASGPATEVFDAFSVLPDRSRLKVTLLDIDLQALAFVDDVRNRLKLSSQITLVNENLIALYLGRGKTKVEPQQLIYSIGLIDYLNDKLVNKLLQYAYDNLAPGGRVILGNFHPRNPAKEFMDYVLEWNLIHRTEEDMNRLFLRSPFKRECTNIQFEGEGVNLFAECIKDH
jgi:extracellular factor (EF) 3-hydroxypalmitic acid methyl ester biosynthesis protein